MPSKQELIDDHTLWDEFRDGNHRAFAVIYSNFFPALYNYGKKFTTHTILVEECVQQLFVELWQSRQNLSAIHSIKPYLYKSFRRKLLKNLKQHTSSTYIDMHTQQFMVDISREEEILNAERTDRQAQILSEAIKKLSDKQREVIFLKFYDKLSYSEISTIMNCDTKVAYDLVFNGIKRLRAFMPEKKVILFSTALLLYIFFKMTI